MNTRLFITSGIGNNIFQLTGHDVNNNLTIVRVLEYQNLLTRLIGFKTFHLYRPPLNSYAIERASIRDLIVLGLLYCKWLVRKQDYVEFKWFGTEWKYGYFQEKFDGSIQSKHLKTEIFIDWTEPEQETEIIVHCRRGDFGDKSLMINYYRSALEVILGVASLKQIRVCGVGSDVLTAELVKLKDFVDYTFEDIGCSNEQTDFRKIYMAKYLVASNSTFCFWAAYWGLGQFVVFPQSLTEDIVKLPEIVNNSEGRFFILNDKAEWGNLLDP